MYYLGKRSNINLRWNFPKALPQNTTKIKFQDLPKFCFSSNLISLCHQPLKRLQSCRRYIGLYSSLKPETVLQKCP